MRRLLIVIAVCFVLGAIAAAAAGEFLTRPTMRSVGDPPSDVSATSVRIPTVGKEFVSGWFVEGIPGQASILLLHGVRSDRRQMLDRARFLSRAGYSVLLIDLPGHGESPAERIAFGAHESIGVDAAVGFLRKNRPTDKIGVIGVSLGAASLLLSNSTDAPEAVVLESMYPSISDAVADRLAIRFGSAGRILSPLLLWQIPFRIGVSADQLRPIDRVHLLGAPLLVASGTLDRHTPFAETRTIFAAANQPKELWPVNGAAHVDLCSYAARPYESKILAFFAKSLGTMDGAPTQ